MKSDASIVGYHQQVATDVSNAKEKVARLVLSVLLTGLLFLALSGCTATYHSRGEWSPDERYWITCHLRGGFGKRYGSETTKKIKVSIYSRGPNYKALLEKDFEEQKKSGVYVSHTIPGLQEKLLLQKEYRIRGSDVSWNAA